MAALLVSGCGLEKPAESTSLPAARSAVDPESATYRIEGSDVQLSDGYFEQPAAPGSAARLTVAIFDTPTYGDLNGDGAIDAALILVYQAGGSGTFYYVAAAMNQSGAYRGTNAVFLGDRILPEAVRIRNRVIVVDLATRTPDAALAEAPTIHVTEYAFLDGDQLVATPAEQQIAGWVTFGHEVHSFRPCDGNVEHWVLGRSPALSDLEKTYRETMEHARPYTPLFMELTGGFMAPPDDGFGAEYEAAFFATQLIDAGPTRHCREEFVAVEEPAPGAVIGSPLEIRGRARGSWFFEGDFPVTLEDASGNTLARSFVTARGEWMTEEFVSFKGTLSFTRPAQNGPGWLIFKKDNPSEQRELDDETSIPVFFDE